MAANNTLTCDAHEALSSETGDSTDDENQGNARTQPHSERAVETWLGKFGDDLIESRLYRIVADQAPIMLWMTNDEGEPIFYNRRWLHYTGYDRANALGNAWIQALHPEDRQHCLSQYATCLAQCQPVRLQYRLRRHDGVYRQMLDIGDPRHDDDGRFTGFVGCTVDITEQHQVQTKLEESHAALSEHTRDISLLNELNDNLQVCKNIGETRKILDRYGRLLFPGLSGTICLYKSSRNLIEPFSGWGDDQNFHHPFQPDQCWALRKGKAHCEYAHETGYICPNLPCDDVGGGYACVPMMAYGEVIGVLNMSVPNDGVDSQDGAWRDANSSMRRLMSMAADQVALALANLQLRDTLHFQSTRDPLTSLFNRRYFNEHLEREFVRARASESEFALCMLDLDKFKNYNDSHGHDAGDYVLREVATTLKKALRKDDLICRYGGEEFAILLTSICREKSRERAEHIRQVISAMDLSFRGQSLPPITTSLGLATYPVNASNSSELIESSDKALYAAKDGGRNRVEISLRNSADRLGANLVSAP